MVVLVNLLAATVLADSSTLSSHAAQMLPTQYEAGHFFAVPETKNSEKLRLLIDTGGGGTTGLYWISTTTAQRLKLKIRPCTLHGQPVSVADIPDYKTGHGLPPPLDGPCGETVLVQDFSDTSDGQLGAPYLVGRVWTFGYPAQQVQLETNPWHADPATHATPLGFPRDERGHLQDGFARITIKVDGQPIDMLLDTGATAHPTAAGEKASGTPTVKGIGVTSYITTSQVERWHKMHPDWVIVEKGDDLYARRPSRIIEVPKVDVAGWSVGPIWFTEQPDHTYHQYMASMMDKPVEGALGGNAFAPFVMTIDYPNAKAYFRCVRGCAAIKPPPAP
jgi:hypothetical protein